MSPFGPEAATRRDSQRKMALDSFVHSSNLSRTQVPGHYPDVPQGGTVWVFAVK